LLTLDEQAQRVCQNKGLLIRVLDRMVADSGLTFDALVDKSKAQIEAISRGGALRGQKTDSLP